MAKKFGRFSEDDEPKNKPLDETGETPDFDDGALDPKDEGVENEQETETTNKEKETIDKGKGGAAGRDNLQKEKPKSDATTKETQHKEPPRSPAPRVTEPPKEEHKPKLADIVDYGESNIPADFDYGILETRDITFEHQGHTVHAPVIQVEQKHNEVTGKTDVRLMLKINGKLTWVNVDGRFKLIRY